MSVLPQRRRTLLAWTLLLAVAAAVRLPSSALASLPPFHPPPHCASHKPSDCASAQRQHDIYEVRLQRLREEHAAVEARLEAGLPAEQGGISAACKNAASSFPADAPVRLHVGKTIRGWWGHVLAESLPRLGECPVRCEVVTDRAHSDVAMELMDPPGGLRCDEASLVVSSESFHGHAGHDVNTDTAAAADYLMTYDQRSDVWINYMYSMEQGGNGDESCAKIIPRRAGGKGPEQQVPQCLYPEGDRPLFSEQPREQLEKQLTDAELPYSALFVGNCGAQERKTYLEELAAAIADTSSAAAASSTKASSGGGGKTERLFDSYSSCLRTPGADEQAGLARAHALYPVPGGVENVDRGRLKKLVSGLYPFALALENELIDDYVTEKFMDALLTGALPVYWGAPNIAVGGYSPAPHSFINALDYESPAALAKYLHYLRHNTTAYLEYFAWRRTPPVPFLAPLRHANFVHEGKNSFLCRTCVAHDKRRRESHQCDRVERRCALQKDPEAAQKREQSIAHWLESKDGKPAVQRRAAASAATQKSVAGAVAVATESQSALPAAVPPPPPAAANSLPKLPRKSPSARNNAAQPAVVPSVVSAAPPSSSSSAGDVSVSMPLWIACLPVLLLLVGAAVIHVLHGSRPGSVGATIAMLMEQQQLLRNSRQE